jgi:hypothetical protein
MDRRNDSAEPVPLVPTEPVALVRSPSLRESWFDKHGPPSSSSEIDRHSGFLETTTPNSSVLCGAFIGLVATAAMLMTAMAATHADVARAIGTAMTKGGTGCESEIAIGMLMLCGMLFGAGFARATIHVERMLPIAIFGVIFAPITWVAMHVFVLARVAPAIAGALPVGGLVMGAAVAGIVLSFVVPLRGGPMRRRSTDHPERVSIV